MTMEWLTSGLREVQTDSALEYLYRRGVSDELRESLGVAEWYLTPEECPDPSISIVYGSRGEKFEGRLCYPILSPRGKFLGFEARTVGSKEIINFRLPDAMWNPCWLGLSPETMARLWGGAELWVCEGFFDMVALRRVLPNSKVVLSSIHAGLSRAHIQFIARFCTGGVVMCYDNDETGHKQTHGYVDVKTGKFRMGAMQRIQREGVRVSAYKYAGGKDPGEIWDRGGDLMLQQQFRGNQ